VGNGVPLGPITLKPLDGQDELTWWMAKYQDGNSGTNWAFSQNSYVQDQQ